MLNAKADISSPLAGRLRDLIRQHGPLTIERYMELCLADPEHGYWQHSATIGRGGDFITAPEISQIFGELIGLWTAAAWRQIGSPKPLRFVELGPGRGTLMHDALRTVRGVPGFLDAAGVHMIEKSRSLRATQQRTLGARAGTVSWNENVEEVPAGPAIVIANEFLDALPIRQLVSAGGRWRERVIALTATGALCFALGEVVMHQSVDQEPPQDAVVELRSGEDRLLAALAARGEPLLALFVDYGPEQASFGDTLQAVRAHAYADPLAAPGMADLTAHVQFQALARKARAAGFAVDGPITQAEFLGSLGIAERASRLMAANPNRAGEIETQVQRLMSPTGMGGLFKVMAIRSPGLSAPTPFA